MKLNLFSGYAAVKSQEVLLEDIVEMVRNDTGIRERTERVRALRSRGDRSAADCEKASTPCFAVAVRFRPEGKSKNDIVSLTGLSLVDIDHIATSRLDEVAELVKNDPHTLLCYTTISGEGLRIIFRINGLENSGASASNLTGYANGFRAGNQHYTRLTRYECDLKCKNATRLSGLSYDPTAYYNPDAVGFDAVPHSTGDAGIPGAGCKVSPRLLAAMRSELADQGIVYKAHHHNEYVMRMGYLMNAYGVSQDVATQWAVGEFQDYDGDVATVIRSCYQHTEDFATRKLPKKQRKEVGKFASVQEIETFLHTQGTFRCNVVTGKIEYLPASSTDVAEGSTAEEQFMEVDDRYVNTLWSRMSKQGHLVRASDMRAVLASEFAASYNPFHSYFESLPQWDGITDYISELADTVVVKDGEQSFFHKYFKKWLVAMVASIINPEIVNHEILVFIGPQGCYKTTWMTYLLPTELRRYFYVKTNGASISKDDLFSLTEFAIICLEEIDELRTSDMNQLKALVSKPDINERAAYGHYKERRPHLASFCGTTNNTQFLTDLTGNRRWLPIEIESIRDPFTHPVNYTGVYSQAYALLKAGFAYYLTPEEVSEVNERNHRFEVPCLEVELILMLYRVPDEGDVNAKFVSTAHILHHINSWVKHLLNPTKIGLAMSKAGFTPTRRGGRRGYCVVELEYEHVQSNQRIMARSRES